MCSPKRARRAARVPAAAPDGSPAATRPPKLPWKFDSVPWMKTTMGCVRLAADSGGLTGVSAPVSRLTRYKPSVRPSSRWVSTAAPILRAAPGATSTPKNSSAWMPSPTTPRSAWVASACIRRAPCEAACSVHSEPPPERSATGAPCSRSRSSARLQITRPSPRSTRTSSSSAMSKAGVAPWASRVPGAASVTRRAERTCTSPEGKARGAGVPAGSACRARRACRVGAVVPGAVEVRLAIWRNSRPRGRPRPGRRPRQTRGDRGPKGSDRHQVLTHRIQRELDIVARAGLFEDAGAVGRHGVG